MTVLRLKSGLRDGFLKNFRLERRHLLLPDRSKGIPGLRVGTDSNGRQVLVKVWPRDPSVDDADLRDLWRDEIRQLHRLAALPGVADHITTLTGTGEDSQGFYLVLDVAQRLPLQVLLDDQSPTPPWIANPKSYGDRVVVWQNLKRLAIGLEALHSQGLIHRNINPWAILTAAREDADFQLTGFEWSMRIAAASGSRATQSLRLSDAKLETFHRDWHQLGDIGCRLLAIDPKAIHNRAIPPYEVSSLASSDEIVLLREIMQIVPSAQIDGQKIIEKIDRIVANLGVRSARQHPKMVLALNLGAATRLSIAVRRASEGTIETDDISRQIDFIRDDLARSPRAISSRIGASDRFKLLLRGQHLSYTIDDFRYRQAASNWDIGYCDGADLDPPAQSQVHKQISVSVDDFELLDTSTAHQRYPRLRGKAASWKRLRDQLRVASATDSSVDATRKSLWLTQTIEYLFALADVFPVEVLALSHPDKGRARLAVKARIDEERETLLKALGFQDSLARRLHDAILGDDTIDETRWKLTEESQLGEKSSIDTEWESDGDPEATASGHVYRFVGERPSPAPGNYYLVPLDSAGRDFQLRRRLKYLHTLEQHSELAQMLSDPRERVLKSEDAFEDNEDLRSLDDSKQLALKALVGTIPLFLVQGPPGVGKTRLVRSLVKRSFDLDSTTRLLLSAQSHYAVDHLLGEVGKLFGEGDNQPLIVRCQPKDRPSESNQFDLKRQARTLLDRMSSSPLVREAPKYLTEKVSALMSGYGLEMNAEATPANPAYAQRAFEGLILRSANAVFATVNSAEIERLVEEKGQFDWTIVEEAGKATGGELIGPLLLSHRRLMIGDHQQLPPFNSVDIHRLLSNPANVRDALRIGKTMIGRSLRGQAIDEIFSDMDTEESEETSEELSKLCAESGRTYQLFETLIVNELERQEQGQGLPIASTLLVQHRMHPHIGTLVSNTFYNGDLTTHPECSADFLFKSSPIESLDESRLPSLPIVWIEMPWVQKEMGQKKGDHYPRWHNPDEIQAVKHVLGLSRGRGSPSLAVLSPYSQQVRNLNEEISKHLDGQLKHLDQFSMATANDAICHTVDSFQGSEADLIIVSLVRNNSHSFPSSALGFLADSRRMNVLLSRARWRLVVIGSLEFLRSTEKLSKTPADRHRTQFLSVLLDSIDQLQSEGKAQIVPYGKLTGATR